MKQKLALALIVLCGLVAGAFPALAQSGNPSQSNQVAGEVMVSEYGKWSVTTLTSIAVGANTVNFAPCFIHVGNNNRQVFPFWAQGAQALNVPLQVQDGNNSETVTSESAASFPGVAPPSYPQSNICSFTATFANTHSAGVSLTSGDGGLAEAMNDALSLGVGQVTIDTAAQVSVSSLTSAVVYPNLQIVDKRSPQLQYWNPLASTATFLAAPTTLTSSTVSSSTTVTGSASFTGGTIHACIAYVDIMGNKSACSGDYSFTDTSAKAIQFSAPAASAGAVGWVMGIGLESGASGHESLVALLTQPSALGSLPVSNGTCTLTTLETVTPACALANTIYGQATSGTVNVATYPVVTSPQMFQLGGVSTTSYFAHNTNAHTTYAYAPSVRPGNAGLPSAINQPFTASAALASTVPFVLGSVPVGPNYMNYPGRTLRICGQVVDAAGGINTITGIQFYWDAQGSDVTTGIPVLIGGPKITSTTSAVAYNWTFCQDIETTVASASATGGSLRATTGFMTATAIAAGTAPIAGTNIAIAAIGSLNLAEDAVIDIVYTQTTGTTPTPQLVNVTIQAVN